VVLWYINDAASQSGQDVHPGRLTSLAARPDVIEPVFALESERVSSLGRRDSMMPV